MSWSLFSGINTLLFAYLLLLHWNANENSGNAVEAQIAEKIYSIYVKINLKQELECGPVPNVMAGLPNIGGALCSTLQSLADAHY